MREIVSEDSLYPKIKINDEYVEDTSRYIVISKMLENYLSSTDVKVIFTDSANKIFDSLQDSSNYLSIIVYYDLVFDNPKTIKKLSLLFDNIVKNNIFNIFIVPIHCIEYHMVKAFGKDCELRDILLNCSDYKNTRIYTFNMNKSKATHEKFCKSAIGELVDRKFLGTCNIDDYNITEEEEFKLISTLPVFYKNNKGFKTINIIDCLKREYPKFIKLFDCEQDLVYKFNLSLNNYLRLIE